MGWNLEGGFQILFCEREMTDIFYGLRAALLLIATGDFGESKSRQKVHGWVGIRCEGEDPIPSLVLLLLLQYLKSESCPSKMLLISFELEF